MHDTTREPNPRGITSDAVTDTSDVDDDVDDDSDEPDDLDVQAVVSPDPAVRIRGVQLGPGVDPLPDADRQPAVGRPAPLQRPAAEQESEPGLCHPLGLLQPEPVSGSVSSRVRIFFPVFAAYDAVIEPEQQRREPVWRIRLCRTGLVRFGVFAVVADPVLAHALPGASQASAAGSLPYQNDVSLLKLTC